MLKINFYPDSDGAVLKRAVLEYKKIWKEDGKRAVGVMQRVTGLKFKEKFINAIVAERRSQSHPLMLRASIAVKAKKMHLIHELAHRLVSVKKPKYKSWKDIHLQAHKDLFLVLYDIFGELYGEQFAKDVVAYDSRLNPIYAKAWKWALSLSAKERVEKFKKLK